MRPKAFRRLFGPLATLTLVASLTLAGVAVAGPDDRASTETALKEIEASPRKEIAQELTTRARTALERAQKLRASGDEPHARLADAVARSWAEAARDVIRAAEVEERASTTQKAATDAGKVADRERALLEEGIAQSGRLRAQLEATTRDKDQPARTSTQANALDGGGSAKPAAPVKPKTDTPKADGGAR